MEEKKYYLVCPETGFKYEVCKEQHIAYLAAWEAAKPKMSLPYTGKPIIVGTPSPFDHKEEYYKMFYENPNKDGRNDKID